MKRLLPYLIVLLPAFLKAQYQGANWVVPVWQKVITIKPGEFKVDSLNKFGSSLSPVVSIANSNGDLLFYSTGYDVRNNQGDSIEDGWGLCDEGTQPQCVGSCQYGATHMQGAITLPKPGSTTQYYLFLKNKPVTGNCQPSQITSSLIDMSNNNGKGKVTRKGVPILNATLSDSRMTACKHANGRDWWLINHEYNTNRIFTHLITPDSIYGPFSQSIGAQGKESDNNGWSVFSSDGSFFVTATGGASEITLLDFDRCSGQFSNHRGIHSDVTNYASSMALSPNGRFLYVNTGMHYLRQYDLNAIDIFNSQVLLANDSMPPYLGMMSLMPDGKIYMPGWSGSNTGLDGCFSVVNQPDLKAPACDFQLRSICVPGALQIRSAPNHPNYNLGALVGSGCDTLQTAIQELANEVFTLYPNPATNTVLLKSDSKFLGNEVRLYNTTGVLAKHFTLTAAELSIDISDLSNGLYIVTLESNGTQARKKLVIQQKQKSFEF